jgi:uncharacterized protein YceK
MCRIKFTLDIIPVMILLLSGCGSAAKEIFSSRTSPDGSKVAENIGLDGTDGGTGRLVIRDTQSKVVHDLLLGHPAPDLFLKWLDSNNLEIWREGGPGEKEMPDQIGTVHVVRKFYLFPSSSTDTYKRPGLAIKRVTVPAENVSGTFEQHSDNVHLRNSARFCVLSIEIKPDLSYDAAKVEITVGMNIDRKPRPSAGVGTDFTLGTQLQPGRQTILTSATISDIPSYNRLPTGDQGTRVRGQFLEQNAAALIEQLKQPAIQIEYSRDFFQQVIKYDLPLTGAAEALQQFSACIGNADFLWLKHDHPR